MIVNNLTRNELLAKVYMRVLKEDQRMDTQHILWDWGVQCKIQRLAMHPVYKFPEQRTILNCF